MFLPILKLPNPSDIYGANIEVNPMPTAERHEELKKHLDAASVGHDKDVYDFRWKLGHQISTLLYSFAIRDTIVAKINGNVAEMDDRISSYVKATNALFQYTASMDSEAYNGDLRPQMSQHNPSFSAHWWKEARKFRECIMSQKSELPKTSKEVGVFWNLHQKVAEKMDVQSSLRQSHGTKQEDFALVDPYFDMFFLIQRDKGGERHMLSQLEDRLTLMAMDLEANGLEGDQYFQGHSSPQELVEIVSNALYSAQESSKLTTHPRLEFNHFACQVRNVDATIKWFDRMFGAEETWRMQGGFSETTLSRLPKIKTLAEIKTGNVLWHIFDRVDGVSPLNTPTDSAEFQHMCVSVSCREDIVKICQRWMELYEENKAAYDGMGKPLDILCTDIINENDGASGIYFTDPNGLEIEVICPPPAFKLAVKVGHDPAV